MIANDRYANLAIKEGFFTRDEYVITIWINYYCNENSVKEDGSEEDIDSWRRLLPSAYQAASKLFEIDKDKAKELYEKSRTIRSRHKHKVE